MSVNAAGRPTAVAIGLLLETLLSLDVLQEATCADVAASCVCRPVQSLGIRPFRLLSNSSI